MTRRELREHCFKMLFCADFYNKEETKEQLEEYFEAPQEDEIGPDGKIEILHMVEIPEKDREELQEKTEAVMSRLDEIDGMIKEAAEGWNLKRIRAHRDNVHGRRGGHSRRCHQRGRRAG